MSEEEIIDRVMMIDQWKVSGDIYTQNELNAIGELLDLYNKEKEKNKLLKSYSTNLPENVEMILLTKNDFEKNISTDYISKDKIREKIEEYNIALSKNQTIYSLNKMEEIRFAIRSMQELLEERN